MDTAKCGLYLFSKALNIFLQVWTEHQQWEQCGSSGSYSWALWQNWNSPGGKSGHEGPTPDLDGVQGDVRQHEGGQPDDDEPRQVEAASPVTL